MAIDNPLQPRGGLLDMMGQGDSGFAGWLNPRRNAIINFGAGMIGADSARDAMRGAAQGAAQGRQQDTAYALLQQEQAEKQRALQEETQQRNATMEFLQRSHPDLAQAVQGGLSVGDAWKQALARSQPAAPDYGFTFAPDGTMIRTDGNSGSITPMGTYTKPNDLISDAAAREQLADQYQLTGADRQTFITTGDLPGGSSGSLTEQQSKDAVFATRAAGALAILDPIAGQLTNPVARAVEGDPTGLARGALQSPEFQRANQAGLEFLQAILRKDTGAAITSDEQQEYGRVYLDQPGDSPEVQAQKKISRLRALEALKAGMAPEAILNMERALLNASGGLDDPLGIR